MPRSLPLLLSPAHPCNYLANKQSSTLFIDPEIPINTTLYSQLAQQGFRRSGDHIYRPHCAACQACKAIRLTVADFQPSRQQRRTWNRNRDLTTTATTTPDRQEHLALFKRYVQTRHPNGGMDDMTGDAPFEFLQNSWEKTFFYEFRDQQGALLSVAVSDPLLDGLSAVYSYFEPNQSKRSLGVMSVLWQIEQARQMSLPYLYLGYWVQGCRKMSYKTNYQPLQWFNGEKWHALPSGICQDSCPALC
ncbi:MAG: arginyltransferase [Gammaproteobacteria bacterium]|nr:arginyltransferase [Gammaproteobacteria bacterium]MCF6229534.1 arginyltransferase [Gammaproteobacteria bacterium]